MSGDKRTARERLRVIVDALALRYHGRAPDTDQEHELWQFWVDAAIDGSLDPVACALDNSRLVSVVQVVSASERLRVIVDALALRTDQEHELWLLALEGRGPCLEEP